MSNPSYLHTIGEFKIKSRRKTSQKSLNNDDSVTYLKNRVTFEKLKENLNSPLFTSTSRDGFKFKDTTCETEKNTTLKTTLKKMVELKKHRIELSKELVSNKEGMSKRQKMWLELENEYLHHKFENEKLREDVGASERILDMTNENYEKINKYCESLKTRFRDFVDTVDKYEEKIKNSMREKDEMVKKYEATLTALSI